LPRIDWVVLGLLAASVLLAGLYALALSGHFPVPVRHAKLRRGWGALVLWATMAATALAIGTAGVLGWRALPWPAAVLGGGAALLFAPLILQCLPDRFVNGRSGLLVLSIGTVILAGLMWRVVLTH
jgi:hypothetical protein